MQHRIECKNSIHTCSTSREKRPSPEVTFYVVPKSATCVETQCQNGESASRRPILTKKKKKYIHSYLKKNFTKNTPNDNLSTRHFLLNCGRIVCIIICSVPTVQVAKHQSLKMTWNHTLKSGRHSPLLLLPNLLTASKHPHYFSSCCSLLVPINAVKHPAPASASPSPSVNTKTVTILSSGSSAS